jgi:hypothetical protein
MLKLKMTNAPIGCSIFMICLWAYIIIAWLVNAYKFICCDFEAPYKDEIIHAAGFIPGVSMITCWF